jgi:hypothetical protein
VKICQFIVISAGIVERNLICLLEAAEKVISRSVKSVAARIYKKLLLLLIQVRLQTKAASLIVPAQQGPASWVDLLAVFKKLIYKNGSVHTGLN